MRRYFVRKKAYIFRTVRTAPGFPRANIRIEETFLVEKKKKSKDG
jgi:hypothetical protein